jgi:hypothetical protein
MMRKLAAISIFTTAVVFAHCDGLDGPVVQAARQALASGDVNLLLPWIPADQEPAIRQAFQRTMSVRTLNAEAKELADIWFFETLVRIHRAGEGAPYEGLKPAGSEVPPAVQAADRALASGDLRELEKKLTMEMKHGLHHRYSRVTELKSYPPANVSAGRKYVAAYVDFIHFAERLGKVLHAPADHTAGHAH